MPEETETTIAAIYRYPVKGLSAEALDRVRSRRASACRTTAASRSRCRSTRFDPEQPKWVPKTHFVMLMRDEALAHLHTRFDPETGELTIADATGPMLRARITEPDGARQVAEFVADFLGDGVARPLRVVEAPGHAFADASKQAERDVRQIRLADQPREPRRARGGGGERRSIRCASAPMSISTGRRHGANSTGSAPTSRSAARVCGLSRRSPAAPRPRSTRRPPSATSTIVGALQRGFGHNLMGIYAEVIEGGQIAVGDRLRPVPL